MRGGMYELGDAVVGWWGGLGRVVCYLGVVGLRRAEEGLEGDERRLDGQRGRPLVLQDVL